MVTEQGDGLILKKMRTEFTSTAIGHVDGGEEPAQTFSNTASQTSPR